MADCSSAWRGIVRAPIELLMAAAAPAAASSVLRLSTVGRTMRTSTRRAGFYGPSNKSTAAKFHGLICSFLSAMSPWSQWALRHSVLAAAARTRGNHKNYSGGLRGRGSERNDTAANVNFKNHSARYKWVSSTSIRKDQTADRESVVEGKSVDFG